MAGFPQYGLTGQLISFPNWSILRSLAGAGHSGLSGDMAIPPDIYKKIVTAKRYMDDHFPEPIDLARLAREACLSRFHFHRLFTRIYKRTPHRYLTQKRIGQARQWLAGNELTVSEICNNVGFESIGSFSALFKKETGAAPQSYRNQAQKQEKDTRETPCAFIPGCFIDTYGLGH